MSVIIHRHLWAAGKERGLKEEERWGVPKGNFQWGPPCKSTVSPPCCWPAHVDKTLGHFRRSDDMKLCNAELLRKSLGPETKSPYTLVFGICWPTIDWNTRNMVKICWSGCKKNEGKKQAKHQRAQITAAQAAQTALITGNKKTTSYIPIACIRW